MFKFHCSDWNSSTGLEAPGLFLIYLSKTQRKIQLSASKDAFLPTSTHSLDSPKSSESQEARKLESSRVPRSTRYLMVTPLVSPPFTSTARRLSPSSYRWTSLSITRQNSEKILWIETGRLLFMCKTHEQARKKLFFSLLALCACCAREGAFLKCATFPRWIRVLTTAGASRWSCSRICRNTNAR